MEMQHPLFDAPVKPQPPKVVPLPPPDELTVFDEAGADDNYEGKLAPHQIQQMRKSVFNTAVIIGLAYLGTFLLELMAWGDHFGSSLLAACVLFGLCTGLCVPLFRRLYRFQRDISNSSVVHIDGRVRLLQEIKRSQRFYGASIRNHAIFINDIKFYVPEAAFKVCRRDMNYRLYYTPITREFVNIHSLFNKSVDHLN